MKWRMGLGLVAAAICTAAAAGEPPALSVEQEVQALKGGEYGPTRQDERLFGHLSCVLVGSGPVGSRGFLHKGWGDTLVQCGDRYVMMLMRFHEGKTHAEDRWRVVDAVPLPPVVGILPDASRPDGPYLYTPDECMLDNRWGTSLYAIVQVGARKRMDWRTGVEGAWGYDLKRQRIVPLSTKRVVCTKPDPD